MKKFIFEGQAFPTKKAMDDQIFNIAVSAVSQSIMVRIYRTCVLIIFPCYHGSDIITSWSYKIIWPEDLSVNQYHYSTCILAGNRREVENAGIKHIDQIMDDRKAAHKNDNQISINRYKNQAQNIYRQRQKSL